MIEPTPDKKPDKQTKPAQAPETGRFGTSRPPAIEDLRFFVKGSLSLVAKFVHDLDWFLDKIKSRDKA